MTDALPETASPAAATPIPTRWVGPIRISGGAASGEIEVPLATYETPLWPSVGRGASISREVPGGVAVEVRSDGMTRSVLFAAPSAARALRAAAEIDARMPELREVVARGSRYAELTGVRSETVGDLLFVRFAFRTGDAAGHNMATHAADALMSRIIEWGIGLHYGSVSGNLCIDKKAGAVNGLLGRGHRAVAELRLPAEVVSRRLRTTAAELSALAVRKNLIGSVLAGAVRSANAHFANMLLGVYLATGQDAANLVEGSQGITRADDRDGELVFSCTIPNLIVGTVGNGKDLPHVEAALARLGCREPRASGENARRLAAITAATVLCGELSLLAAQTNPGELMSAHLGLERRAGR